ncbi:SGNH/GDSL hydrolase family protein [Rathayibacter iranicus]|uniref:SGNH/GDSL hydrolase family protein n=2 Tax=Rathayibacter iranicus TaxID=59737 RepID=A0AAD1EMZ9_9MICO|nr:SGNH/GDSL hydrolase family protein [Rathayibacter iranicus]AZZ56175.1 SGNH/GDSL hydrolase family protein [Rathayibacter iranicus]MWV30126.1 hypothetical protein [Rathayibacter iranicus NCPPB 2253 = VKM Ac-1602]PPI46243.1 hypothetical protein C5E09_08970 [Rathayibacter iranicus]PPI59617.1 hypothetical protein C5E08_09890 [Rathayibacter iranicus]PPI71095.1 hypothetical protein C5E01_08935 [Rathayibacter iranicus]
MKLFTHTPARPSTRAHFIARTLTIGAVLATVSALAPAGIASAATSSTAIPSAATPSANTPSHLSLLSLGDSTTQANSACGTWTDCPDFSWSTGSAPVVNSIAQRLQKLLPDTSVSTANYSKSGSTVAGVPARVQEAVDAGEKPDVITLLIGGNDLCGPGIPVASDGYNMTPVSTFRTGVETAITTIRSAWPSAKLELSSVPDNATQWEASRGPEGQFRWSSAGFCRTTRGVSMTEVPLSPSDASASVAAAAKRVVDFNAVLEQACAADGPLCNWDGGALTRMRFTPDLISEVDHFHPSAAGQAKIAEVEWNASSFAAGWK